MLVYVGSAKYDIDVHLMLLADHDTQWVGGPVVVKNGDVASNPKGLFKNTS
jgi:hypothetical protein